MIMVDTGLWLDFINGIDSKKVKTLTKLIADEKEISFNSIIMMELLQGCKNEKEVIRVKTILKDFYCYVISHNAIIQANEIYRACKKGRGNNLTGQTVSPLDCIIASNCIENNVELLHRDKHFDFISKITGTLKIYSV